MQYRLNDHNVHEGMYMRAKSVSANGGKVFFVSPQLVHGDAEELDKIAKLQGKRYCRNCDGLGRFALQVFTGGPYAAPDQKKHVTWHDGSWYVQDTILFVCPDCSGSGLFGRQAPRPEPVSL